MRKTFFIGLLTAFLLLAVPWCTAQGPAVAPPAIAHHVIVISIDGCRPDALLRANTPVIHELLKRASFTFYAETTDLANTLPSHTSMLTGVQPATHGIDFNKDLDDDKLIYPKVKTLLEIAHEHHLTTGVFSTKVKFRIFTPPGVVDYVSISKEASSPDDMAIARDAAAAIVAHKPGAMLVHFGNNDKVGHAKGWGSPEQMAALEIADAGVGAVFAALREAGIEDDTLVIITADHGGSGTAHGTTLPSKERDWRLRYIPWIAVGPRVRKNFDLTSDRTLTVHTEDTFATACYFLGLPIPPNIYGKPLVKMISGRELVETSPTGAATQPGKRASAVPEMAPLH